MCLLPSVALPCSLPGIEILRRMNHLSLGQFFQSCGISGATGNTEPASDAAYTIYGNLLAIIRYRLHLATFDAGTALRTYLIVHNRKVVRSRDRFGDPVLGNTAQYAAAASAAVADIEYPFNDIAHAMDQSNPLRFFKQRQCLFP